MFKISRLCCGTSGLFVQFFSLSVIFVCYFIMQCDYIFERCLTVRLNKCIHTEWAISDCLFFFLLFEQQWRWRRRRWCLFTSYRCWIGGMSVIKWPNRLNALIECLAFKIIISIKVARYATIENCLLKGKHCACGQPTWFPMQTLN